MSRGLLLGLLTVGMANCLPPAFRIAGNGGAGGGGGTAGIGGATGTAGASGAGGVIGAGGAIGDGGRSGTGGTAGTGGKIGAGGVTGTGGVTGSGGVTGAGGSNGAGGATNPRDASVDTSGDAPATGLNAGLIGYWTFDQAATVYPDRSGNHNDAHVNPPSLAPTWVQSTRPGGGGALQLQQGTSSTAANTWLEVAASPSLNSVAHSFTMAAWLLMPKASTFQPSGIITRQVALEMVYGLELTTTGALELVLDSGAVATGPTAIVPTMQWVHVASTYDGVTANLYIGGQLKQAGTKVGSTSVLADHSLFIGAENDDAVGVLDGLSATIDDVLFYSRVLSANEIAALAAGVAPVGVGHRAAVGRGAGPSAGTVRW